MSLTYSQNVLLPQAPDFQLPDAISGKTFSLAELKSNKATVIMFICNHCPFVGHIEHGIAALAKEYQAKGVSFIAICANDIDDYPEDSPAEMKKHAAEVGYTFPYLFDATQQVAKDYGAECTPEFFIFDGNLKGVYHGRFDDSTPGKNIPVTGNELRAALDAVLAGKPVPEQHLSVGCNIKWKS